MKQGKNREERVVGDTQSPREKGKGKKRQRVARDNERELRKKKTKKGRERVLKKN